MNIEILRIYRYEDTDANGNKIWVYCYSKKAKDNIMDYFDEKEEGTYRVKYYLTTDEKEIEDVIYQYAIERKLTMSKLHTLLSTKPDYTKLNFSHFEPEKHYCVDYHCKDLEEVKEIVEKTYNFNVINEEKKEIDKAKKRFDNKDKTTGIRGKVRSALCFVKSIPTKVVDKYYNIKEDWQNLSRKGKFTTIAIASLAIAVSIGSCSKWSLNRDNSPTNSGTKTATGSDDEREDDNDNNLDKDIKKQIDNAVAKIIDGMEKGESIANDTIDKAKAKAEAEKKAKEEAQKNQDEKNSGSSNTTGSNPNYSNSGSSSSGSSSNNTKPTKPAGSVDDSYNEFQDPNASIDDSNNGSSNSGNDNTDNVDDPYQNVTEDEEPVKDEENTNDEDYSEEIDVPADNEIILDPDFEGNEGAINDDISYDVSLDNDGEYDNVYVEELPDPDKTAEAGDGDYVTTEDELKQTNPENDVTSNIDVVPVEQETQEPTITIDTTYTEPGTIETVPVEQTYTINEQEAERAVEAMANGEAGNVVVNTDGSISFEAVENTETNSMTK